MATLTWVGTSHWINVSLFVVLFCRPFYYIPTLTNFFILQRCPVALSWQRGTFSRWHVVLFLCSGAWYDNTRAFHDLPHWNVESHVFWFFTVRPSALSLGHSRAHCTGTCLSMCQLTHCWFVNSSAYFQNCVSRARNRVVRTFL